ncbi:putative transcriptional regulatory protein pdtaR [Sporomusa acidovorans DSM 3132]|uniref:Transcriptional regulatory protein pdtaR n=2 Tax=Sporomusa TaxID=2375 RepID=A0ABZ3J8Q4_SPOA4|nr:putative transcriptional regulatory protein pdtaR [Sporomusa acidovorans DSM 3132]SDF08258.1 response regulator receiver and ANTAR domain protein [Sporomusa acidovorans]
MIPLSILIAEDEVLTRVDIKAMLEKAGYVVCGECSDGRDAVNTAKRTSPDLAILDIMMPKLDGLEVAKIFQNMNIPVIMLTAYSQPSFISRAECVHACGYLIKPTSENGLLAMVRIAYARWKDTQNIKQELAETKNQLANQQTIAHARVILKDKLGVSEQEAHRQLLRQAMQKRVTLVEVAKQIISSHKAAKVLNNSDRNN